MPKKSAGILAYRLTDNTPEVLLVHPGGPIFARKDLGVWSIPKGEFEDEEPLAAALREFKEETGIAISGTFMELNPIIQKSGKKVYAFAIQQDMDVSAITSNTFTLEWPAKSGRFREFPEVDKAEWFPVPIAIQKIIPAQSALISQLVSALAAVPTHPRP